MGSNQPALVLGIDGGGTKTEAVLLDSNRNVIVKGLGGPSNRNFVAIEVVESSLRDAVKAVLRSVSFDFSSITLIGACFAGRMTELETILREFSYQGRILGFSECEIALERAGVEELRGIVTIAGTGSSFWGTDGVCAPTHIGGWGPVAGEEGSGFHIGIRGIQAAGRAQDGRGPQTILLAKSLQHFGASDFNEILVRRCRPTIDQYAIASFAKVVTDAAKQGDEVSIEIVREAAQNLANDTVFTCRKFFSANDEFPVVLAGGVFNAGDMVIEPIKEAVLNAFPKSRILLPKIGPGEAAARLTLRTLEGGKTPVDH